MTKTSMQGIPFCETISKRRNC